MTMKNILIFLGMVILKIFFIQINTQKCACIICVCFYGARLFDIKLNQFPGVLQEGSTLLMYGKIQNYCQHQISISKCNEGHATLGLLDKDSYKMDDTRISTTCRWFVEEPDMNICKAIAIARGWHSSYEKQVDNKTSKKIKRKFIF